MPASEKCPACGQALTTAPDGRAQNWRIRVRLYDSAHGEEPVGDSDAELAAGEPGARVLNGLPAVALAVADDVAGFHERETVPGMTCEELVHRLKSLRPTLSRRGGNAVWRLHYQTDGLHMLARVDVEKAVLTVQQMETVK